jgi:hypothetical protein
MNTQIAKRQSDGLAGAYREPSKANEAMAAAMSIGHLVSPATSVATIPEGFTIALSCVFVQVAETYPLTGGKRGLSKVVLEKIGAAVGVTWDARESGRVDDGSDPAYCHWQAVGHYRGFDGQWQTIVGNKEMDLRHNSPQVEALHARVRGKADGATADKQIREMRLHILRHAETKARLAALRSMGIDAAYTEEALARPFVAVKLHRDGHSNDPGLKRMFAAQIFQEYGQGVAALYGSQREQRNPHPGMRLVAPPPVGSIPADIDDLDSGQYRTEEPDQRRDTSAQQQQQQQPREERRSEGAQQPKNDAKPGQQAAGSPGRDIVLKFSRSKGRTIGDADAQDLEWIRDTVSTNLDSGESRYPESDKKLLDAVNAELAARSGSQY